MVDLALFARPCSARHLNSGILSYSVCVVIWYYSIHSFIYSSISHDMTFCVRTILRRSSDGFTVWCSVACRQLGYPEVVTASGRGTERNNRRRTGIVSINCSGNETRLIDCTRGSYPGDKRPLEFFQSICHNRHIFLSCCTNSSCSTTDQCKLCIQSYQLCNVMYWIGIYYGF